MHDRDFFVSHTAADAAWAQWIAWEIEAAGHSVVIGPWDVEPGRDFVHELQRGLRRCARVIAVLSESYVASAPAEAAWRAAFREDPAGAPGRLIGVRVAPCEPPDPLGSWTRVDLVGAGEDAARATLLAAVTGHDAGSHERPPFPDPFGPPAAPRYPGDGTHPYSRLRRDVYGRVGWRRGCANVYAPAAADGLHLEVAAYDAVGAVLGDIYRECLAGKVPPYSYGETWLLTGSPCLAPVGWARRVGTRVEDVDSAWQAKAPAEVGLTDGCGYSVTVLDAQTRPFVGLLTDLVTGMRIARNHKRQTALLHEIAAGRAQPVAAPDGSRGEHGVVIQFGADAMADAGDAATEALVRAAGTVIALTPRS